MVPKGSHHCLGYLVGEEMLVCRVPLEYLEEKARMEVLDLLEQEAILVKREILVSQGNLDFLGRREHLVPLEEREARDFLVSKAPEEKLDDLGYPANMVQMAQWVTEDHPVPSGLTDSKARREHPEDQDYPD